MSKFHGVDYYEIDGLLSEEEILIRSSVRQLVDDAVLPVIEEHYRNGTFPETNGILGEY